MSIDSFACHAVRAAVLDGDLDSSAGQLLSLLPKSTQETTLSRLMKLSEAPTGKQLMGSLNAMSIDLTKTTFAKSECNSCLHNSNIANRFCGDVGEFKPNHCLFPLCAQHGAKDPEILSQRTIVPHEKEQSPSAVQDAPDATGHPNPDADSKDIALVPVEGMTVAFDFEKEAQMDLGEPDHTEPDHSDAVPGLQGSPELHAANLDNDANLPPDRPNTGIEEPAQSATSPEPQAMVMNYVDEVRNAWWRNALKVRVADQGTHREFLDFLISCFTAGFKPLSSDHEQSAPDYFYAFAQPDGARHLAPLVASMIDALPLEMVGEFLQVFNVDLTESGSISVKLLAALELDELAHIADELNVPDTDELCNAYQGGSASFAQALVDTVGSKVLSTYIPPSLRP
ncbi:hypothetical protein V8Z74_14930 [Comamonas sp. w2-DMI]|uniref:hypothetical protein n=1 Tax=Comamonas sp. w2-DMI TaxID=3126391 RepID=UPI0032E48433